MAISFLGWRNVIMRKKKNNIINKTQKKKRGKKTKKRHKDRLITREIHLTRIPRRPSS